jgi:ketosteroid isomerase-like protein
MRISSNIFPVIILVVMVLAGCQPNGQTMLSDTDRAAIKKTSEQAKTLFDARDFPAFVKFLYTEDAIVLPPNKPAIKGHEANISLLQKLPPFSDHRHETLEIEGMGNLVYNLETCSITAMPQGLPAFQVTSRVTWIWKKQADGSWKVWREMYNHDSPAQGEASSKQQ